MIYLLIGFFLSGAKISMQIIKSKHLMLNVKETLLFVGYVPSVTRPKAFIFDNHIQTLNFAIKNDRL